MGEVAVGRRDAFGEGDRRTVLVGADEVVVFCIAGALVAYRNQCPHQGGPVCDGMLIHKVEERIAADGTAHGLAFSDSVVHLACPWHGWEFDVRTGACAGDGRHRLRRLAVVERDGHVFVAA